MSNITNWSPPDIIYLIRQIGGGFVSFKPPFKQEFAENIEKVNIEATSVCDQATGGLQAKIWFKVGAGKDPDMLTEHDWEEWNPEGHTTQPIEIIEFDCVGPEVPVGGKILRHTLTFNWYKPFRFFMLKIIAQINRRYLPDGIFEQIYYFSRPETRKPKIHVEMRCPYCKNDTRLEIIKITNEKVVNWPADAEEDLGTAFLCEHCNTILKLCVCEQTKDQISLKE
ncbi:MAG: hypothetical protein ACFFB2_20300 [Promethearchaeota archaeon]